MPKMNFLSGWPTCCFAAKLIFAKKKKTRAAKTGGGGAADARVLVLCLDFSDSFHFLDWINAFRIKMKKTQTTNRNLCVSISGRPSHGAHRAMLEILAFQPM